MRLLMPLPAVTILVAALTMPLLAQNVRPEAAAVARSLQSRYEGIQDFSADFTHTYRGGVLRTSVTEEGTMAVKRPGMMRWQYTRPEQKTFVSDGNRMYAYIPADRQVIVSTLPPVTETPTPALFLAGRGDLARDFDASWDPETAGDIYALRLVPRGESPDYTALVVTLDPATLQIQAFSSVDHQGGRSTFTFRNLKENQRLSDKEFVFRMPRGVDILTDDQTAP
jgi:outer membrane lipoprotein carrier protein